MCACLRVRVPLQKGAFGRQNALSWKGSLVWEQAQNSRKLHIYCWLILRAPARFYSGLSLRKETTVPRLRGAFEKALIWEKALSSCWLFFVRKRPPWGALFEKRPPWGALESAFISDLPKAHLFWICGKRIYFRFTQTESAIIFDLWKAHLFCRKRKWKAHY